MRVNLAVSLLDAPTNLNSYTHEKTNKQIVSLTSIPKEKSQKSGVLWKSLIFQFVSLIVFFILQSLTQNVNFRHDEIIKPTYWNGLRRPPRKETGLLVRRVGCFHDFVWAEERCLGKVKRERTRWLASKSPQRSIETTLQGSVGSSISHGNREVWKIIDSKVPAGKGIDVFHEGYHLSTWHESHDYRKHKSGMAKRSNIRSLKSLRLWDVQVCKLKCLLNMLWILGLFNQKSGRSPFTAINVIGKLVSCMSERTHPMIQTVDRQQK